MDAEKEKFLKEFGDDYGYPNAPKNIDQIRASEFKRLEKLVYLDHGGATLYSELQMEAILKDLTTNVYGNPHSQSDASSSTSDLVRAARQQVLDYCKASPEEYKCIFTSGATAALKLVGETFPWSKESTFMYTMENHNSVLGIREYALNQGAMTCAVDIEDVELHNLQPTGSKASVKISQHTVQRRSGSIPVEETSEAYCLGSVHNLFAFPSECNFSGMKFSLDLVRIIKEDSERVLGGSNCRGQWMVLIDAAKACATQPPDLSRFPADFVVVSFYKIFGYPTGLGALIVRTKAAKLLKKTYFSGGTVSASIADVDFVKRREDIEDSFEDGTLSFLSVASIRHGFGIINSLTIEAIDRHTSALSIYVRKILSSLRHGNDVPFCTIYGDNSKVSSREWGPTIAFNLKRADGSWFGYREVEKLASLSGIQLRTGCFCNPGACSKYLGLSHSDLLSNIEAGHICWDDNDILNGKPVGAVRISFGYMSTFEDAKKFISFLTNSFLSDSVPTSAGNGYLSRERSTPFSSKGVFLKSITVYPIKSCAGFSVVSWPLSNTGLQHDREWLLRSPSGEILTQKKVPEMCLISTYIDLFDGMLCVKSPRCKAELQINLETALACEIEEVGLSFQRYEVQCYGNEVNDWFTNAIGRPCTLLRCFSSKTCSSRSGYGGLGSCRNVKDKLNFVNEAQFLLVSEESVSDLNTRIISNAQRGTLSQPIQIEPMRFRPNLVISGAEPYEEDNWTTLMIGKELFMSLGGCKRCEMINLDTQMEQVQKSTEPLATLASFRRTKGKIFFGILLRYEVLDTIGHKDDDLKRPQLQVGDRVLPDFSNSLEGKPL